MATKTKAMTAKKPVKKATSRAQTKAKTKSTATSKLGRNADGTFAAGNQIGLGNNGGRPTDCMSFRQRVKIRASNDPRLVDDAIDTLIRIATDPTHPKCVEAIDKLIKLNGNYDPAETKDVTPTAVSSPLNSLTVEELYKLKALKAKDSKGSKK